MKPDMSSSSEESEEDEVPGDSSLEEGEATNSDSDDNGQEAVKSDKWGPQSDPAVLGKQLSGFLKKHQRVDTKEVTLILTKEMLNTYFNTV